MKKAVGYIRVSTNEQAKEGVSLSNQATKVKAYAMCKDLEVIEVVEDAGKSAKNLSREGIQRVLEMVRTKAVDAVIIYKLDRLTRSVKDLGALIEIFQKAEVDLMSVQDSIDTSTAAGRLVLNVMASVSQWEREAIGERTSEALQHKKANGEKTGGLNPLGYDSIKKNGKKILAVNKDQRRVINLIQNLKANGMSVRAIAKEMEHRGIKTATGKEKWYPTTVQRALAGK